MNHGSSAGALIGETRDWATARHNLPNAMPHVLGRGEAIEDILRDVREARLVSIVGAGGIGKTTVALAVAERSLRSFDAGVWLVELAPLNKPSLVPNAIAAAVGLVVHSADIMAALCRFLRDRDTLLVLDNCEHVVDAVGPCV
ncbi:MAG TPA: AAA family ATPase, partial [Polyangiaceae bacterium]|nr:AAA family ATPase [Polyangiaceae bacterium]